MTCVSRSRWLLTGLVSLASSPLLFAQDEAAAAAAQGTTKTWMQIIYVDGGPLMVPLTLCSVGVFALAAINWMALKREKFIAPGLVEALTSHMSQLRVRSAIDTAAASPTYLGRLIAAGLSAVDGKDRETLGKEKVEEAMAEYAVGESRGYMQWIGYFSLLAQVAPMLGLLGTVQGMIGAFANLEAARKDTALLAANISIALYTTAAGLVIAIPAILLFYYFRNKLNTRVGECLTTGRHLLDEGLNAINPNRQTESIPEGLASY
jgi:biopolymer transport protein ExbB